MKKKRHKHECPDPLKIVTPKTENQENYIRLIIENDITLCIGPSGCGKSFLAAGMAAQKLYDNETGSIVITRPLVSTGKDIGSLPGELNEKIKPYLIPMEEKLKFFLGRAHYGQFLNLGQICYFPLELMRGMTFYNSYMILDEAQNCTYEQIKMFITRMGKGSKVLINGDINQTDLKFESGLAKSVEKLYNIDGVGVSKLTHQDIQRHGLIGRVLTALEE